MPILLTDLDNTLLYSHRRDIGAKKEVVEWYQGQPITYMTRRTQALLRRVAAQMEIIPCTTRSIAQYKRVQFLPDWMPQQALVCNGGVLLRQGVVDIAWQRESLALRDSAWQELLRAKALLEQWPELLLLPLRWVDDLFLFTKSEQSEQLAAWLMAQLDLALVQVHVQEKKLYVLPKELHKGTALQRLRQLYPTETIYAAGDSQFDVSMLLAADFAFAPMCLGDALAAQPNKRLVPDGVLLSEELLACLA